MSLTVHIVYGFCKCISLRYIRHTETCHSEYIMPMINLQMTRIIGLFFNISNERFSHCLCVLKCFMQIQNYGFIPNGIKEIKPYIYFRCYDLVCFSRTIFNGGTRVARMIYSDVSITPICTPAAETASFNKDLEPSNASIVTLHSFVDPCSTDNIHGIYTKGAMVCQCHF